MAAKKENIDKNQKKAFVISIVTHGLLLILFFMIAAWTEPDPPIPEYGIELAFIGQPSESVAAKAVAESRPVEELTPEPLVEEQIKNVEEESVEVTETVFEDESSPDVVEETNEVASTNAVEEEQEKNNEELQEQEESVKEIVDSSEDELVELDTVQVAEEEVLPELDDRALFKNDRATGSDTGGGSNMSGSSLDMSGWQWDYKPEPDDKSTENGKIIFQVTVDGEGEIIAIKTIEKTVSPIVEKVYKNAVMDLTFSKTANNKSVAANSKGRITFIIRTK